MTVYAVASGKGGVGKTTTAIALGASMAAAGQRTVVVDADLGMPDLAAVLGLDNSGVSLHDVLAGSADIKDAIRQAPGGFDVIPGGAALTDYAAGDPAGLRDVVATLADSYDIVILDTAAGLSQDVLVPLGIADETILVSTPADAALQDAEKTRQLVDRVDGNVAGIVLTRVIDVDSTDAASTANVNLLGMVPEDNSVRGAEQASEPVTVYAPDGPAGSAYIEVTAALLGVAVGDIAPGSKREVTDTEAVPFASESTEDEDADASSSETDDQSDDEEATQFVDTSDDEDSDEDEDASRSLLNRLTGGLLG